MRKKEFAVVWSDKEQQWELWFETNDGDWSLAYSFPVVKHDVYKDDFISDSVLIKIRDYMKLGYELNPYYTLEKLENFESAE